MRPIIHLVVGARPNYIKANPVFQRLDELDKFDLVLVNTGQHYDHNMAAIFIDELGMKAPDMNLGVGPGTHGTQTAKILAAYEEVLIEHSPDLVVVFGDVNSTIACSLAATKLQVPVAHVEAGLRSFDSGGGPCRKRSTGCSRTDWPHCCSPLARKQRAT